MGVDRLYNQQDSRLSYVVWDEQVTPIIVVELLSPGTEKEDLGEKVRKINQPPTKWEVYEQILKIPYYIVYDRYTDKLIAFELTRRSYHELDVSEGKVWIESLQMYLGVWHGRYKGLTREWLRWLDANQNLIPLPEEKLLVEERRAENAELRAENAELRAENAELRAENAELRAENAKQEALTQRQRAENLAQQLRALGIDVD